MGEAKRRGTFAERREQAIAKRIASFAAPKRIEMLFPRRQRVPATALMILAAMAGGVPTKKE